MDHHCCQPATAKRFYNHEISLLDSTPAQSAVETNFVGIQKLLGGGGIRIYSEFHDDCNILGSYLAYQKQENIQVEVCPIKQRILSQERFYLHTTQWLSIV